MLNRNFYGIKVTVRIDSVSCSSFKSIGVRISVCSLTSRFQVEPLAGKYYGFESVYFHVISKPVRKGYITVTRTVHRVAAGLFYLSRVSRGTYDLF